MRTCNDHLLVVLADKDAEDAKLNVEGTDFVLIVMPTAPRTHGPVVSFLVPSKVVVEAARSTHRDWRASNPNTKGDNKTWNLWFADNGPEKARSFARKWAEYRLEGTVSSLTAGASHVNDAHQSPKKLGEIIASAKQQIADDAGVTPDAVRITVNLA